MLHIYVQNVICCWFFKFFKCSLCWSLRFGHSDRMCLKEVMFPQWQHDFVYALLIKCWCVAIVCPTRTWIYLWVVLIIIIFLWVHSCRKSLFCTRFRRLIFSIIVSLCRGARHQFLAATSAFWFPSTIFLFCYWPILPDLWFCWGSYKEYLLGFVLRL